MKTQGLSLYQTTFCPFCIRVRRALEQIGIELEIRDVMDNPDYRRELVEGTGRQTVPVLRIDEPTGETHWMPESLDIIRYLQERFAS